MATYAIGDIQGCYDELLQLLEQFGFGDDDRLWVAGDLVNRGPKSLETLRFLKSLGKRAKVVLGNHDLHLLAVHYGTTTAKRHDTLNAILQAPDRDELMDWLRSRKLLVYDKALNYCMVHAGIPPHWTLKQARKRAKEVEWVLRSKLACEYFKNMYGNQPDCWQPGLEGWDRLRVITNYLTRMRFCDADGRLDFSAKEGLESQPEGFLPWFRQPREARDLQIIFGHWAALEGRADAEHVYALDTGCVWGNALTAMRLEDKAMFSLPCQGSRQPDGPHGPQQPAVLIPN
ncbi:symmetrical bis(5'-nucleosyl)-tetraphosphatase [Marinobacterium arenosum]|uniref:symmetrical bis(5'-nucleosyl)-tetraphosphatase n=1 Tax=Marinobacterium arenosum TaxID=2862496 RepID=UPI001C97E00C|nr:symmetrical bis(5'-nucleosyl)-tetraphosphatase [Marinobacterium arenosum]MBY4676068.1 symmetrical bis(5'-nucleosyl)-tetraphosphatase [Marinobacterium arenosum]